MPKIQRPFNPAQVTATTVTASLPDRLDGTTFTRFARYPRLAIRFLAAQPNAPATTISFSWPVDGAVRVVDVPPAEAAALGVSELIELSPLPFQIASILRALGPGLPTFYVGLAGTTVPAQDSVVRISDAPLQATRVVIGCVFQDRMTLEPWSWIKLIGGALTQASPADAPMWQSLGVLDSPTLQVRDVIGQPAPNQTFDLRFLNAAGNEVRQSTLTTNAAGDLGQAALPQSGEHVEVTWQATPAPGDVALPVLALYEPALANPANGAARSFPGSESLLTLPEGFTGGHLQILDLARLYTQASQSPNGPWPARFRPHSRMEPLIDGIPAYTRLVEDMRSASGIHLAGWAFDDFPMRPYDPTSSLGNLLTSLGRDKFRILVTKSLQTKVGALDSLGTEALVAALLVFLAFEPLIATGRAGAFDGWGILVWHAAALAILAAHLADPNTSVLDFIRSKVEFTQESVRQLLYDVSGGKPNCAFPAPYPAAIADNPLGHDFSLPGFGNLSNLQELWGVFHQKLQVLAVPNGGGSTYVGYLGGVDINSNRMDGPGHHAALPRKPNSTAPAVVAPYHDVHARVTGPATLDIIGLFHERYNFALNNPPNGVIPEPLYQPPSVPPSPAFLPPATVPPPAGQHLLRIAQTSYKADNNGNGFPWAPEGDAPIRQMFERMIVNAREYIHIEDQYFTLDNVLIQILRNAADHCRRLVIVVPFGTPDQLFGDERRLATFERLAGATGGPGGWGNRMVVGTPFRRSVLPPAVRSASIGRAVLVEEIISATASKIYVGPATRVPLSTPYFFWVAGELMYATKAEAKTSPGGQPSVELDVLRSSFQPTQEPKWCPHPRPHQKGAPVTFSAPRDIFVHAKLLIVDDMFVSVGSSNWNRRGFFHDGEANVFAVPDRLRASRDNPALQLRTALWAEHLGITPFMGRSLLADPVEGFDLFRRTRYQGNRLCPIREFLAPRGDLQALNNNEIFALLPDSVRTTLMGVANSFALTQIPNLWNTLTDATTELDPNPTPGPVLP